MKHATNLALALALALGGCAKDEPKTDEAPAVPEAPAAEVAEEQGIEAAELAPEDPETTPEGVPVPEDFEEEAARTLHLENLDVELDRLEAEIEG